MNQKPDSWFGYMGQILRIDLTTHKYTIEPLKKDLAEIFLAAVGSA